MFDVQEPTLKIRSLSDGVDTKIIFKRATIVDVLGNNKIVVTHFSVVYFNLFYREKIENKDVEVIKNEERNN